MWEEAYNDAQTKKQSTVSGVSCVHQVSFVTPTEISILTHFTHNSHSHR